MNLKSVLYSIAALLILSGCAVYVTGYDGNEYKALSEKQIRHLVHISRVSLKKNLSKKIISPGEYRDAMNMQPEIRIDYRGDRYGTANISWRTRGRKLEFLYHDDLTAEVLPCSFATSVIPPQERRIMPDKSIPGR